jgi:phosphoribosylaminoimidazolecarboxamide formyltransferase/IMP cyclohydrolase
LSASDKAGLIELSRGLAGFGVELLSTGGSAGDLRAAGFPVREVSDLTGFPEIMDGRVKTLHPRVHGGLLARRDDPGHKAAMAEHGIEPIDLLAVNLYPFEAVRAKGADAATSVENIDVGGPAMIRAAAKNHAFVAVLTDPADYAMVLAALAENGGALPFSLRRELAAKAFARTAAYDAAIAGWFAEELGQAAPRHFSLAGRLAEAMRYGENPHQRAALYLGDDRRPGAATAELVQGKALSFNNVADADAAFELAAEFDPARTAAAVIVKHGNPCGAAEGANLEEGYRRALACDPVSAFGGVVALNRPLDAQAAQAIAGIFTEVIVAPDASSEARATLSEKKNLRLLLTGALPDPRAPGRLVRSVSGGFLLQDRDNLSADDLALDVVTKRAPTEAELADLRFAFRVAKHVKSNAIVYARDGATVGIGAGQMSRVDSCRIAALKAEDASRVAGEVAPRTQGSVVASDAFFPFADGLLAAVAAGATAVVQPGGSVRDAEVIAAADAHGIAMAFTGVRHFRH